jgi:hypothetical protein
MVAGTYEQELRQAHIALIGALRRLDAVMAKVERSDMRLSPDADGNVPDWTPEQFALVRDAAAAWADLVRRSQDYDGASTALTAHQPNTWPHA